VDWKILCQSRELGLQRVYEPEVAELALNILQNEFWYKIDMNLICIPEWMLA